MFILEGPDHVGKTTAAKRLVELAHARGLKQVSYRHMSRPPEDFDYFGDYLKMMTDPWIVQDRFHYGGLVYGDICRGGTKISNYNLCLLESVLALQGSYTVVMVAEQALMQQRLGYGKAEMY